MKIYEQVAAYLAALGTKASGIVLREKDKTNAGVQLVVRLADC